MENWECWRLKTHSLVEMLWLIIEMAKRVSVCFLENPQISSQNPSQHGRHCQIHGHISTHLYIWTHWNAFQFTCVLVDKLSPLKCECPWIPNIATCNFEFLPPCMLKFMLKWMLVKLVWWEFSTCRQPLHHWDFYLLCRYTVQLLWPTALFFLIQRTYYGIDTTI